MRKTSKLILHLYNHLPSCLGILQIRHKNLGLQARNNVWRIYKQLSQTLFDYFPLQPNSYKYN